MLPRAVEPGTVAEVTDPGGASRGSATVVALPVVDDLGADGSVVSVSLGS
jgi:hypothetical protein